MPDISDFVEVDVVGQRLQVNDIIVMIGNGTLKLGKIKQIMSLHTHPITLDGYQWQKPSHCLKLNDINKEKLAIWLLTNFKEDLS